MMGALSAWEKHSSAAGRDFPYFCDLVTKSSPVASSGMEILRTWIGGIL